MTSRIIGIDIGYGYTKIVTDNGNGMVTPISFPSVVGTYEDCLQIDGIKKTDVQLTEIENQRLLIGNSALKHSKRKFNSREKNWIDSIAYRALLKHAIALTEPNSVNLTVVTGLPVSFYKSDKEKLINLIRAIVQDYCLSLTVKVIPQPLGAFFNLLFNDSGIVQDTVLPSQKIGVLDIGFYTTDLITVDGLEIVEKQIDSLENGVSTALEAISRDIENLYGIRPDLHKTEQAVKEGCIKAFGTEKDISPIIKQRLQELEIEIEAKAKTIWKSGGDIDKVILSGGGAALLRPYLNLYPHATVIENAQFANAKGYYRYGKRVEKNGG